MNIARCLRPIALAAVLLVGALSSPAVGPTVRNVTAQQISTTQVRITFDLVDPDSQFLRVTLSASTNNGATYNLGLTNVTDIVSPNYPTTLRGPMYDYVSPGTGYTIYWNAAADWPQGYSTAMRLRVAAQDMPYATMLIVPAGSFMMGNAMDDTEGQADELPPHSVNVAAFKMDQFEVTGQLWNWIRNWALSSGYQFYRTALFSGDTKPMRGITWGDAMVWCNARSQREGLTRVYYADAALTVPVKTWRATVWADWTASGYRLPTEAEWERAARGGQNGHRFPWSDVDVISHSQANYYATNLYTYDVSPTTGYFNQLLGVSVAGSFQPNGYGFYDMAGNLAEWCWDVYDANAYISSTLNDPKGPTVNSNDWFAFAQVYRGGGWADQARGCRVAARKATPGWLPDTSIGDYLGLRTVRKLNSGESDSGVDQSPQFTVDLRINPSRLRALEVVQSLQDWTNSVPLVAGKPTYVRAYLEADRVQDAIDRETVNGRLRGRRPNGTALPGPEFVVQTPKTWNAGNVPHRIYAKDDTAQIRDQIKATMNFELPPEWTAGQVELSFEALDFTLIPAEPAEPGGVAGDAKVTVDFVSMPRIPLVVAPLQVEGSAAKDTPPPDRLEIVKAVLRAQRMYPTAKIDWTMAETMHAPPSKAVSTGFDPSAAGLVSYFEDREDDIRDGANAWADALVMGAVHEAIPDDLKLKHGGQADKVGGTVAWSAAGPAYAPGIAHELGHLLELPHPVAEILGLNDSGMMQGYCTEEAKPGTPSYPWFYRAPFANDWRPFVSPQSVVGGVLDPDVLNKGGWPFDPLEYGPLSPATHFEVMSYCEIYDAGHEPWIGQTNYARVMSALPGRFGGTHPRPYPGSGRTKGSGTTLVITGFINVTNRQVVFRPVRCRPDTQPKAPEPGSWQLVAKDALGNPLAAVPFPVQRLTDSEFSSAPMVTVFRAELSESPAIRRLEVYEGTTLRAVKDASLHPPTVAVVSPNGGEVLGTADTPVTWLAADADGDALSFTVQYSVNGGISWTTLGVDLQTNILSVSGADLRGSTNALVRVLASDGFHCVADQSDGPFTILPKGPEIFFVDLGPGRRFYAGGNESFECVVLDHEDGVLAGTNVVWDFDQGGAMATGNTLQLTDLFPGAHELTIQARDSAGNITRVTNAISVESFPPPTLQINRRASDGVIRLLVTGSAPSQLVLELSTNLVDWLPWRSQPHNYEAEEIWDWEDPAAPARFYRARLEYQPTVLSQQPAGGSSPVGSTVNLSVTAAGQYLRYQWYFNGEILSGATKSALTLTNAQIAQSGGYFVVVRNPVSAITSSVAQVSVTPAALGFQILHHFAGGHDGIEPRGPLTLGSDGALYGCTLDGGIPREGMLFRYHPATSNYTILRELSYQDGWGPRGGMIEGSDGFLYGTSEGGGTNGGGTVWKLNKDGTGFVKLRQFNSGYNAPNLNTPYAGVIEASDGFLYGIANHGGLLGNGGIFKLAKDDSGFMDLTDFNWGTPDAPNRPETGLVEGPDGALYGTSYYGGIGHGTVFRITRDGATRAVIGNLGANSTPSGAAGALLLASNGLLYGACEDGVFVISTNGSVFATVANLINSSQGTYLRAGLVEHTDGTLLGTASEGGSGSRGVVFGIAKNGTGFNAWHRFGGLDGNQPSSPLRKAPDGWYYGTTAYGGTNNLGTLYRILLP